MNLIELDQALRKLRLSGMADVLDTRLQQAQVEQMAPIDLVAALVSDELQRRQDRLLARRHKQARFRDPDRSLDSLDLRETHRPRRGGGVSLLPCVGDGRRGGMVQCVHHGAGGERGRLAPAAPRVAAAPAAVGICRRRLTLGEPHPPRVCGHPALDARAGGYGRGPQLHHLRRETTRSAGSGHVASRSVWIARAMSPLN